MESTFGSRTYGGNNYWHGGDVPGSSCLPRSSDTGVQGDPAGGGWIEVMAHADSIHALQLAMSTPTAYVARPWPASGLPEPIPGLDARGLTLDEVVKACEDRGVRVDLARIKAFEGHLPSPTQMACALGHHMAYREIVARKLPAALVLEEDAIWTGTSAEVSALMEILGSGEPRVVQLSSRGEAFAELARGMSEDFEGAWRLRYPPRQTTAYLINAAAARLATARPIDGLADWPSFASRVQFLAWVPWLFTESGSATTIELPGYAHASQIEILARYGHMLTLDIERAYRVFLPRLESWLWRKRGRPRIGPNGELWRVSLPSTVVSAVERRARRY